MPRIGHSVMATVSHVDGNRYAAVGAWSSRTLVGVAHRICSPAYPHLYDVALAVADEHQGQGIGSLLMDAIAEDAAQDGVTRLTFHLSGDNGSMAKLLANRNVVVRYRGGMGEGAWNLEPSARRAVPAPEFEVQKRREAHPEHVWNEQRPRGRRDPEQDPRAREDGGPQHQDLDHGQPRRAKPEEEYGPEQVEPELREEDEQGGISRRRADGRLQQQVQGDAHRGEDGGPYGREEPIGGIERRLLETRVPPRQRGSGDHPSDGSHTLAQHDATNQQKDPGQVVGPRDLAVILRSASRKPSPADAAFP